MLDGLIESGKRALEVRPEDLQEGKGGTKVLSADEVRSWRRDSSGDNSEAEGHTKDHDDTTRFDRAISPARVVVPDAEAEFLSEEEVEAMTFASDSPAPSPKPPPIHVIPSP